MADGFLCADCGWQETSHVIGGIIGGKGSRKDPNKIIPGYRCSLYGKKNKAGHGYKPSQEELAFRRKRDRESAQNAMSRGSD